ncbi:MAG: cupin domain-containing protein [Anaerolineae bacterium]|nr:cupin domain-containing protein [Anaerolineae bacterium]
MTFFKTEDLPATEMLPGVMRRAVYLDNVMITFFDFEPRRVIPAHAHPHEQITYVVRGALAFTMGQETRTLRAGEGVCIPPNVTHSAVVLDEPAFVLDAWNPVREDYK